MRRSSADPESGERKNKKVLLRRRITLPSSRTVLSSSLSNGQAVSDINVVNGNQSPRLETRKSDADATSLSAGSSASVGATNPQQAPLTFNGPDFDLHKTRNVVSANLHRKIHHMMELIRMEQQAQAENVNEYLESVKSSNQPNFSQQQQHTTKSAFEKKNQKSTQAIMAHQGKLDNYQKKLAEVQQTQTTHGTSGRKDVLKNVSHGLNGFASPVAMTTETMAGKPAVLASKLRHRLGSTNDVSSVGINSDEQRDDFEQQSLLPLNKMSLSGVRHSISNSMAAIFNDVTEPTHKQDGGQQGRSNSMHLPQSKGGSPPSPVDRSIPRSLQEIQEENNELRNEVTALKTLMHEEFSDLKQMLDMEHDVCDRLEEQLNDLTELHQHEMANIKQEMVSLEEKMQYTLDDRTRDLHELLENCIQRVTKVEQQQHQQLTQTEASEGSSFSIGKIINVILGFLSFCLIILSTLASLVSPFLSTRLRYFMTFLFVVCSILAWRNWDFVSYVASAFASAYLLPWLPEYFQPSKETAGSSK